MTLKSKPVHRNGSTPIVEKLEAIYNDYPAALAKGKAASKRMRSQYTWALAGQRLLEILERYAGASAAEKVPSAVPA